MSKKINLAVITGRHPHDVMNFKDMFGELPEINVYPQDLSEFAMDTGEGRKNYDVVLFYNMHTEKPEKIKEPETLDEIIDVNIISAIEELAENDQGIFFLHHSILAFPEWDLWSKLVGIEDRTFDFHLEQDVELKVNDLDHPILDGVENWEMQDETYTMDSAGSDCQILLTTNHEKSMETIAWTRKYKGKNIFCFQSGHDNIAYSNPNFCKIVLQGIEWLASE